MSQRLQAQGATGVHVPHGRGACSCRAGRQQHNVLQRRSGSAGESCRDPAGWDDGVGEGSPQIGKKEQSRLTPRLLTSCEAVTLFRTIVLDVETLNLLGLSSQKGPG
jgi:hypothetical protein